jgi:pilus assembly protein CpaF
VTDLQANGAVSREDVVRLMDATGERMTARIRKQHAGDGQGFGFADERALCRQVIHEILGEWRREAYDSGRAPLASEAERSLARKVHDLLYGLGDLQPYIDDPTVTDIRCNGCDNVHVRYVDGRVERKRPVAGSDAELVELVRTGVRRWGRNERRWDGEAVAVNLQLPDGSRLHAIRDVTARPVIDIRCHRFESFGRLSQLEAADLVDRSIAAFLLAAVLARFNLLIGGAPGVGKTTLMRCLLNEVPADERIITIEDSLELGLERYPDRHADVVSIEARPPNTEGSGEFTLADGVYEALRMPGRFVVGETRGPETIPMLRALSSGDNGSLSTIHAMSSANVFDRVKMYAREVADPFPVDVVAAMAAEAIQFVVFLSWDSSRPPRRRVQSIREVVGVDGDRVVSNEIWAPDALGRAVPHARLTDRSERRLAAAGYDLSLRDRAEGWWRP